MPKRRWREPIGFRPKMAGSVPAWDWPGSLYFLPVARSLVPFLRGAGSWYLDRAAWIGTEEEIEQARESLRQQLGAPVLHLSEICGGEWGALFQEASAYLQEQQGEGLPPPPWEFRIIEQDGATLLQFRTAEGE